MAAQAQKLQRKGSGEARPNNNLVRTRPDRPDKS